MSVRSGSAGSSRGSGEFREVRLPNSKAVKALIYFCGRDPRKAKSVRRYYDDDFDTRSTGSGGSMFSWSSGTSGVYLVETTAPYWYWDEPADAVSYTSSSSKSRKPSRRGRSSRQSQRSNNNNQPTGTWQRRATVEDDDEDDSSSDDGSEDFGDRGPSPYPHPNMMHPMPPQPGPPPGAFQPMYGMPQYPQHATPRPTPSNGMPMPPPPPPMAGGMPPPPPGGHFVPGRGGIQVFVDG